MCMALFKKKRFYIFTFSSFYFIKASIRIALQQFFIGHEQGCGAYPLIRSCSIFKGSELRNILEWKYC